MEEEIEKLKREIAELEKTMRNKKEFEQLKKKKAKLEFQQKHSKILKVTGGLEKGFVRMFKGLGSGMRKAGKALEKSDAWIAEQQAKENTMSHGREMPKQIKDKKKKKMKKQEVKPQSKKVEDDFVDYDKEFEDALKGID